MSMILDKQPIIATYKIDKIKKGFFFNLSIENHYQKITQIGNTTNVKNQRTVIMIIIMKESRS